MSHPPVKRYPEDKDASDDRPEEAVVVHLPSRGTSRPTPSRAKRYTSEFRAHAVALARRPGVTVTAVAQEVGVSVSTLRRWLRDAGSDELRHTAASEPPQPVDDPRPVRERIEEEWPDWRTYDWPVLPAPESEAVSSGTGTAPSKDEPSAPQPAPRAKSTQRSQLTQPRQPIQPGPAAARDLAAAVPTDGVFAATARLSPLHRLVIVLTAFAGCIVLSRLVPESYSMRPAVSALHVMSLVASFGAVLLVDWHGLLWLAGRRALTESTRLAAAASPIIWMGLGGLFVTGTLLRPDIGSPLTLLKLALVLAVSVNGAVMAPVRLRLAALSSDASPVDVPEREWRQMMLSTAVSQVGWWGAVVIGFVNSAT
ncbi:transposase [Intrasporangium sp. DVR]|uniref:transposase n=1 Tax=Intrasporangium sp. DVR TaxID=3127867 RepID=UPI00313A6090